ncbi:MAG TPA: uracil phosphoribosyltransferase [Phycisphaerales bacterium]|nr:uracil phosphoribosyltransferase [Phycisphaerales bacterium]|tara:strand:+ start:250 stop:888 length:639 start_codon:yes stop_codon:yes gene_type:complete
MNQDKNHLTVLDHPVAAHLVTRIRDVNTTTPRFRELVARVGMLLAYEATRDIPTQTVKVTTPIEETEGFELQLPVTVVPILRAGLGLAEGVMQLIPQAVMGHVGMFRDEKALTPVSYYEKLPTQIADGPVLLIDPMLATGGSAAAAIDLLKSRGCTDIRFLCLISAPEGIEKLTESHPDVPIFTAAIDQKLNEIGYIVPGLGDAGDRLYGTL